VLKCQINGKLNIPRSANLKLAWANGISIDAIKDIANINKK
jgi:hypothetical protein